MHGLSELISIVAPGAPARGQIADQCPNAEGDGDGLIGIIADHLVGGFDVLGRFFTDPANQLLAAIQGGCKPLASFRDFISGNVGGGCYQGTRIFSEGADIVFIRVSVFIHSVLLFLIRLVEFVKIFIVSC
jgi:hypothetical protein